MTVQGEPLSTSCRKGLARRSRQLAVATTWRPLAVAAALASALGVGCVRVNADVPEVEVTRENLTFQALPDVVPTETEITVKQSFAYDQSPVDLPNSITTNMRATEVTVTVRHGATDLSFVHFLTLTLSKPGSATQTIIDYARSNTQPVGASITVPVQGSEDALNPWEAQDSTFEVTATGTLPRQAWSIDVTVKFSGSFSYSL
jgi:hypothetical protein